MGASSKLKSSIQEVKEHLKKPFDDLVLLGVFKDENDPMFLTFLEANNDIRDEYVFGHTFDSKAKDFLGVKESSILIAHPSHLVSKYEPKFQVFKVGCFEVLLKVSLNNVLLQKFLPLMLGMLKI